MSRAAGRTSGSTDAAGQAVVAALYEGGDRWHVVIASGSPARLVEARSIERGVARELDEMLRRFRVGRLVRLVPGSETVVRCVSIPQAGTADAAAALGLIAEAELPDSIPRHRRAAGIIPDAHREGAQTGLLVGWPVRSSDASPAAISRAVPEGWAAEAAALAALRGDSAIAGFADARTGSISLLVSGPARSMARVLREDNSAPDIWAEGLRRALTETCRTAGFEGTVGFTAGQSLLLSESARAALAEPSGGKAGKPEWLETYGLALGAAMLALSENSASRPLAGLSAQAPALRQQSYERAIDWLSVNRNAWKAVAVASAALLLLPLGLAWATVAVLDAKVGALHAQAGSREELARVAALHAALRKTRWPMTKLLADISGSLPLGVRVESIRLAPDQGLGLEGTADSADGAITLQQNLNKSGIFRDVRIARADTSAGGAVTFEIAAAVVNPTMNAPLVEDFAAQPLAVRLYGEGASNTNWTPDSDKVASTRPGRPERPARTEGDADKSDAGKSGDGPATPSRPSGSGSDDIPEALTDEQIQAMDFNAAMKAWAARKKSLSTQKSLDQPTKDRLTSEVDRLKAQMDAKKAK